MESTAVSFWRFLAENKIEIPIIQRDYAQGRSGKESLRKTFLGEMKASIDNNDPMKFDFVYGIRENGYFIPLDGQQRLTTLWLLHWYVAYRANMLIPENINRLKNGFTYKTRISSREFCERLASFTELPPENGNLEQHVKNQICFRQAWQNDPTIQSMLRMLSGSLDDRSDGIAGVFPCSIKDCSQAKQCTFEHYWKLLTSPECPLKFYYINLLGIARSDGLYIKMNARGKPLTGFENFKADLVNHIKKHSTNDKIWSILADLKNGFAIQLDRDWINKVFWPLRIIKNSPNDLNNGLWDGRVDDIIFAFFNRFCANEYAVFKMAGKAKFGEYPIFDYFYGRIHEKTIDDSRISYAGFSCFHDVLRSDRLVKLNRIFEAFDMSCGSYERYGVSFTFIPKYYVPRNNERTDKFLDFANTEIPRIQTISQKERVFFFAFCEFLSTSRSTSADNGDISKEAFNDWMRVVWNIVENSDIGDIESMTSCLKLVNDLSPYSQDILTYLSSNPAIKSGTKNGKMQFKEEIEKAKQSLLGKYSGSIPDFHGKTWKEIIDTVEREIFFKGAIRFLFTDANGNTDWTCFDTKYKNAKNYFDINGVRKEFRRNALLLRAFLARIKFDDTFWFGNGKDFWRNRVLLNQECSSAVSDLLLTTVLDTDTKLKDTSTPEWIRDERLLSTAIGQDDKGRDLDTEWHVLSDWMRTGSKTLTTYKYKVEKPSYSEQIIPLYEPRNELLAKVESDQKRGTKYFIGWTDDIIFTYENHKFKWSAPEYGQNVSVSLLEDSSDSKDVVKKDESLDSFKQKLNNLIDQATTAKSASEQRGNPNEQVDKV